MSTHQEMACQRCTLPLNILGNPPTYLHPLSADTDGHQPVPVPASQLDTIARRCDFCGDPYPVWTLTGDNVTAVALGDTGDLVQNFGDHWATCTTCQALIDDGKTSVLVDRAAAATGLKHDPTGRVHIARLHTAFLHTRRPGRTLITTTAWPPTSIHARDLPKIRDRLARLYRSDNSLPPPLGAPDVRRTVADGLDRAALYWIDPEFTDLAQHAAAQLPDTTINRDDMPTTDGLLVWSRPVTDRQIIAATWTTSHEAWNLVCYRAIGAGLDSTPLQRIREQIGWLVPTRTTHVEQHALLPTGDPAAILIATWLLIAQKLAETTPAAIDPAIRKAYARAKRPAPDVRVVRIRPHTRTDGQRTTTAERQPTYKGRFWVSGHWRNQAYGPGRTLRRPVFINPHLKGSDDLPISQASSVRVLGTTSKHRPQAQT